MRNEKSKSGPQEVLLEIQRAVETSTQSDIDRWEKTLSLAKTAAPSNSSVIPPTIKDAIENIIANKPANKYLFSILVSSCVKKILEPRQDVRIAQDNMEGGYSNRSFDQRFVTPFLKRHGYTHCEASGLESGRNFERPLPWDLEYPSNPRGKGNRESFLGILHYIEEGKGNPRTVASYLLHCDKNSRKLMSAAVHPPLEPKIRRIMKVIERHFRESSGQGKSRLPVLALFAIYEQLVKELTRYRGCEMSPLQRHTTADMRSGSIGDIQVNRGGKPYEGVEVKSEKPITADMINEIPRKLSGKSVSRYYILTTYEGCVLPEDRRSVESAIDDVEAKTGCQVIANGLIKTMWYYLRLIRDPSPILRTYQKLVDRDPDVRPGLKKTWNVIVKEEFGR